MTARNTHQKSSLGEEMIESLTELCEAMENEEPLDQKFTVRTVELDLDPHEYGPDDVRALRRRLGTSQAVFARLIGADRSTVQKWEQGERQPRGVARRLLDDIAEDPERWRQRLRNAAIENKTYRA